MQAKPLHAKFRIYPQWSESTNGTGSPGRPRSSRWFYYQVFVWKRRDEMRKAIKDAGVIAPRCEAICCCNRIIRTQSKANGGRSRLTGLLGQIHFYEDSFRMGIITHECTHAALDWAREAKVDPLERKHTIGCVSNGEEIFAWVLGNLARQVVIRADEQWKFPSSREAKGGYAY